MEKWDNSKLNTKHQITEGSKNKRTALNSTGVVLYLYFLRNYYNIVLCDYVNTEFQIKKKRFSVTKKYTEEWTVIKPSEGPEKITSNGL